MGRKRIVLELDETAKPGPHDPMNYMPTVGPNTSIELNGGVWNFVAFEDTPPAPEPLKPCFCGYRVRSRRLQHVNGPMLGLWQVTCDVCGVAGPHKPTEIESDAAWNRRVTP